MPLTSRPVPSPSSIGRRLRGELRPHWGTLRRRAETHPLRTWLQRGPRLPGVDARISPHDAMYVGDGAHYFSVGASALRSIEPVAPEAPLRVLDMPCGHGRVLRFLKRRYPDAALVACDLDETGVEFCAERFGAEPVISSPELASVVLPGEFDLIWCGSLATHLDAEGIHALLDLFRRSLAPAGVAVITTHGSLVADRLRAGDRNYQLGPASARAVVERYDTSGFGYGDYAWSPGYGVSVCSRAWIEEAAGEAGLRTIHFAERAWDDHQDVIAVTRPRARRASWRPPRSAP
jgi:SAM-dependent methyltransferase